MLPGTKIVAYECVTVKNVPRPQLCHLLLWIEIHISDGGIECGHWTIV